MVVDQDRIKAVITCCQLVLHPQQGKAHDINPRAVWQITSLVLKTFSSRYQKFVNRQQML